jgi:hypothetical protein
MTCHPERSEGPAFSATGGPEHSALTRDLCPLTYARALPSYFHFQSCFQTCTSVWIFLGVGSRV